MTYASRMVCAGGLALLGAGGCSSAPVAPSGDVEGSARVQEVSVAILESFPVQVHVTAHGYLSDACTTVGEVTQLRDGNRFVVSIGSTRPADAVCATVIVEFEEVVALDVLGLPAGTYTVDVNGVMATFTLSLDNTPL